MEIEKLFLILIIGLIAGFCEGTTGAGWGVFTLAMLVVIGVPPLVAVTSSIFVELILGILNNVAHFNFGNFDWKIAVPLLISGTIAVTLGARVSNRIPEATLRLIIGCAVVFFGLVIIAKVVVSQ